MHRHHQIRRRRGTPTRSAAALGALASALLVAACGGPTPASGDVHMGPADEDATTVVAIDNAFEPETLELDAGAEVTIEVVNEGEARHNLVVDDMDLSTGTLESGEVATATFTVPASPVTFRCSLHPGMDGEIQPSSS